MTVLVSTKGEVPWMRNLCHPVVSGRSGAPSYPACIACHTSDGSNVKMSEIQSSDLSESWPVGWRWWWVQRWLATRVSSPAVIAGSIGEAPDLMLPVGAARALMMRRGSAVSAVDLSGLDDDEVEEVLRKSEEGLWSHLGMNADVEQKVLVVSLSNGKYIIRNWWQLAYVLVTRLGARSPREMDESLGQVIMWLKDEADRQRPTPSDD